MTRVAGPLAIAATDHPHATLHRQILAASYAIGAADAARDMAAAYAQVREQFERPIGWFQAIKHLCADMAVRCAIARSQLYYAACALDAGDAGAAFPDRKRVWEGKSVSVRVDLGGRRFYKTKKQKTIMR